jgi:hypothetical protein
VTLTITQQRTRWFLDQKYKAEAEELQLKFQNKRLLRDHRVNR